MKKQVLLIVLMLMPLMASANFIDIIDGVYYNMNSTDKVAEVTYVPSGSSIYSGSITIPRTVVYGEMTYSVTRIGVYAFQNCSDVISIDIPNSVTSIGYSAFKNCSSLTSITIPNSVKSIESYTFQGCSSLSSITIPNSVISIESYAFSDCSELTYITIGNKVTSVGDNAFSGCSKLKIVNISDIATWCDISFSIINSNPLNYADHLFLNGEEVKDLVIPNSVTSIRNYTFQYFSGLTSVTIPNSVMSIGDQAFVDCSGLTTIVLGRNIENIGSYAFAGCESLEDVYCHAEKVPSTETNAFVNSYISYATLHVPENSINQYRRREPWSGFETFTGILDEEEIDDGNKCAKPVITLLANGKIKVESSTEGATCVTNITASNAEPLTDSVISLNTPLTVYTVTSYATKEGYNDSEVATATFRYEKAEGDMNGDGMLNITDVIHLVNMILGQ